VRILEELSLPEKRMRDYGIETVEFRFPTKLIREAIYSSHEFSRIAGPAWCKPDWKASSGNSLDRCNDFKNRIASPISTVCN
jgi:hypothetical protein